MVATPIDPSASPYPWSFPSVVRYVQVQHLLLEELAFFRVKFKIGSFEPLEADKLLRGHLADNDNMKQV